LGAGLTFPTGDAAALELILGQLATQSSKLAALRSACSGAAAVLQPEVAARYMFAVIQAPVADKASIRAPWYP
jgi:hypothetical protein